MDQPDFKQLWGDYSNKLDITLKINKELLTEIKMNKTKSELNKFMLNRIFGVVVAIAIIIPLSIFVTRNYENLDFLIAGLILDLIAIAGLAGSLIQLFIIRKIDYSGDILTIQKQLEQLKFSNLFWSKLMMLSLPFYFAYHIVFAKWLFDFSVIENGSKIYLLFNLMISLFLIPLILWLILNLNYRTKNPIMQRLLVIMGGPQIAKASKFLNEIEAFTESK